MLSIEPSKYNGILACLDAVGPSMKRKALHTIVFKGRSRADVVNAIIPDSQLETISRKN